MSILKFVSNAEFDKKMLFGVDSKFENMKPSLRDFIANTLKKYTPQGDE